MTIPKYWDGSDKKIDTYYLAYDDICQGWLIYKNSVKKGNAMTIGSQKQGTQLLKVYKSADSARRAFAKTYDKDNSSKYVNCYAQLLQVA